MGYPPPKSMWERAERNEATRGLSFLSYVRKHVWVHAESWASPAESGRTLYFAHATRHQHAVGRKLVSTPVFGGVHTHQTVCYLFPFGRLIILPRCSVFLGLHWIYSFSITNQHQLMWQIIFHSVRSYALWGGWRHALSPVLGPRCMTPKTSGECDLIKPLPQEERPAVPVRVSP